MEDHIIKMFLNRAGQYGSKEAMRYRNKNNTYNSLNWNELDQKVRQIAASLESWGYKKGDRIGIFSPNKAEWLIADLGILANGSVVVPFYATASQAQVKYIVEETGMTIMFVGTQTQLEVAVPLLEQTSLEKIIMFDDYEGDHEHIISFDRFLKTEPQPSSGKSLEEKIELFDKQDIATIIYTSGTTGEPKGVILSHDNFMFCFQIHDERLEVNKEDVSLCFLPLSHVFERLWSHYILHRGAVNVFLENPREVIEELPRVKPQLMCTVPRFFDKTYQGIQTETAKWSSLKRKIFRWSIAKGLEAIDFRCRNKPLPSNLKFKLAIADKLVLSKLRKIFGGKIKFMPCAGAAINTDVLRFFHAVGLFVNYGYGATETTATVSCFRSDEYYFGTCGSVMPRVEVKIGKGSEILVRGRSVFQGYYKKEEATQEVLKDGWFYTGDEGYLDDKGNLFMLDRIKDLMKTSVGKYVSPQKLELLLSQDKAIEQLIVVGDNRQYVSALIVPSIPVLKSLAQEYNIRYASDDDLINSPQLIKLLESRFAYLQKDLTAYERVVKFTLLKEPFTIEEGTMTSTLKLRRANIEKSYKHLIDQMYA